MLTVLQSGALGEAIATARLLRMGCTILTPSTPEPFDIMAILNGRCVRVQVKAASKPNLHQRQKRYSFSCSYGASKLLYPAGAVDIFVLVATDIDRCWVVPAGDMNRKSVKIPVVTGGKWLKYVEAWELLEQYSVSHETCRSRSVLSQSSDSITGSSEGESC